MRFIILTLMLCMFITAILALEHDDNDHNDVDHRDENDDDYRNNNHKGDSVTYAATPGHDSGVCVVHDPATDDIAHARVKVDYSQAPTVDTTYAYTYTQCFNICLLPPSQNFKFGLAVDPITDKGHPVYYCSCYEKHGTAAPPLDGPPDSGCAPVTIAGVPYTYGHFGGPGPQSEFLFTLLP
ncbi:hypothetical protein BGW37DRAFT_489606 [Umbelopsis sp. PMI_123]|nr:hypothetical protein BGW37DRAFT_489606 [Umbelopsis sp. PMI_123]